MRPENHRSEIDKIRRKENIVIARDISDILTRFKVPRRDFREMTLPGALETEVLYLGAVRSHEARLREVEKGENPWQHFVPENFPVPYSFLSVWSYDYKQKVTTPYGPMPGIVRPLKKRDAVFLFNNVYFFDAKEGESFKLEHIAETDIGTYFNPGIALEGKQYMTTTVLPDINDSRIVPLAEGDHMFVVDQINKVKAGYYGD